jgi:hypothetical protein
MSNNNTAVYVDLDDTLINAFSTNNEDEKEMYRRKFETAEVGNIIIVLRPFARQFLQSLNKITPNVYILTAGLTEHQSKISEAIGILKLSKGLFGRDAKNCPTFELPVLIDDLGIRMRNTYKKLYQMGVLEKNDLDSFDYGALSKEDMIEQEKRLAKYYISIKPFELRTTDNEFNSMLPKVIQKLDNLKKELRIDIKEKVKAHFIR